VLEGRKRETLGHGLSEVRERAPDAERRWTNAGTEREERHALARVIGAGGGGIAAVVGGEQRQIAGPEVP
jgi:hypothetical protein